jgi:hypothetical protein
MSADNDVEVQSRCARRNRRIAALIEYVICVLAASFLHPFCGFLQGAALNVTETRLGLADSRCAEVRLFDIAPDGRDFAYAGPTDTPGAESRRWATFADERMVSETDSIALLQFSSSGGLLIGGTRSGKQFVSFSPDPRTIGPLTSPTYDRVNWRSVIRGSGDSAVTFAAERGPKWLVVSNGVEGKQYDGVGLPCIAADGKTVLYPAFEGERFGKAQRFVVSGGKEGRRCNADFLGWLKPGNRNGRLAYAVAQNGKVWVVDNERAGTKYDDVGWLEFVPGTNRLYYAAQAHGKWFIVKEGYPLRERYDDITGFGFSPDGRRLALVATSGNQQFCVADGRRGRNWDEVVLPQYSPDSRQVGYLARRGDKWSVVINERAGKAYDGVSWPVWSHTSSDVAYRARLGGRYCLVVDGVESGLYDDITRLWWSPDPRTLLAAARQGRELLLLRTDLKK